MDYETELARAYQPRSTGPSGRALRPRRTVPELERARCCRVGRVSGARFAGDRFRGGVPEMPPALVGRRTSVSGREYQGEPAVALA